MPATLQPVASSTAGQDELVVITRGDAGVRAGLGGVSASAPATGVGLQSRLAARGAVLQPLFGLSEDRLRGQVASVVAAAAAEGAPPVDVPDLALFYRVDASGDLYALAEELRTDPLIEAAYVKPAGEPPQGPGTAPDPDRGINRMQPRNEDAPPATPNFVANQIYLNHAPAGVDAQFAGTLPGGGGAGIRIIDCEWGWRFTHEDLLQNQTGVLAGSSSTDTDHGTAVLGVISGDRNAIGITGIAPDASIGASSFQTQSSSAAIKAAADKLGRGDIILLEIHRPGPNAPNPRQGQLGFIAIEWWPDDFAAIRYAVAKGIIVVEAAGNGFENLDAAAYNTPQAGFPASWRNPFNLANPQSGAVIVGAGAPPPNTHGRDHGPDRSRLDFSNHGLRVDVQGWGREVTTTGYGDLQGGSSEDLWYTDTFSGTSSASPVVVGALAAVQGDRELADIGA